MHILFSYTYLVTNLLLEFLLYIKHVNIAFNSCDYFNFPHCQAQRQPILEHTLYLGLFSGSLNLGQTSAGVVLNADISG